MMSVSCDPDVRIGECLSFWAADNGVVERNLKRLVCFAAVADVMLCERSEYTKER
jgi:hypothetical protein